MVFRIFDPITGGRVSEIVEQESKWHSKKDKYSLPTSSRRKYDRFEEFCDDFGDFIDVSEAHERFVGNWELQKAAAEQRPTKKKNPLLRALLNSFYGDLLKATFCKLVWSILLIFSIRFFVFEILDFIKARGDNKVTTSENYEYYLCAGFFGCMVVLSIGIQQMGMYSSILGGKVKGALTTAIYKKMIVRDAYGSKADVVALVAKDVEKIAEACGSFQYLWSGIFETAAVFAVVLTILGATVLPGVALMLVFLPAQYCLGLVVAYRKKHLATVSTQRISLMEEIMRGIKLIKIYGWEASFFKNLAELRTEERGLLARINSIQSVILGLTFCLPPLLSASIFGTQEATGKIESVVVFTSLSFFNTLRVPFSKLPKSLRDVLDALASLKRIQEFLLEPDLAMQKETKKGERASLSSGQHGIIYRNVSLSYGQQAKLVLDNINLDIPAGSLVMVAGSVGGGKSNLLKSMLGDLTIREGTISVSPSKAYVPQVPWTTLGTVRDNIVFGLPFDESHYRNVLHACALEPDLKMMADGDQTWIGERGGNLSGGQKQRIALARAAYSRAKLYVLDSPLSAVDMYTCQHIFKFCIEDMMIAAGGTVVLATHQTELFSKSDHLIVMEGGKMVYNDKYAYHGVKHLFPSLSADDSPEEFQQQPTKQITQPTQHKHSQDVLEHPELDDKDLFPHDALMRSDHGKRGVKPKLVPLPKKETDGSVYSWWIKQMGVTLFTVSTLFFINAQIARVYGDSWISTWSKRKFAPYGYTSDGFYAGLYALLVMTFLCMAFMRAYLFYFAGRVGARNIHDSAFISALKAPMHFFHVTPIGKLLSIFAKDIYIIDDILVDNFLLYQIFLWILVQALGVVAYNLLLFLSILGGLTVAYLYVVYVFIRTSVPLKKASGESQSQVVAHTAETLSGLAVVRAFRQQETFLSQNLQFQSRSTVVSFSLANLSLWLAFRVDIIGSLLVLGCCLLALLNTSIDAADAGLIVSNSFQILLFFSIMSRTMGEVHDNMNSVEQARTICALDAEHEVDEDEKLEPHHLWPGKGEIEFEGVVMPYFPNSPPVLKGITFSIRPGEKIGVVGRTGAGKSSLIVALYRMADITKGEIHVDSIDCSRVKLRTLRRSMAIIPQEPVMFSGTLRTNLDPFYEHKDDELMDVLNKCLLGSLVKTNEDGLNAKVEPLGANYSLGTQQLICLARAMLNPSRILLLDEATAALDSATNAAVQQVIKEHFSDRTIFTIAHRLDTIIDSDRILTMNHGVVAEFDAPHVLLADPESIFRELCMNTGKAKFEALAFKARANAVAKGYSV